MTRIAYDSGIGLVYRPVRRGAAKRLVSAGKRESTPRALKFFLRWPVLLAAVAVSVLALMPATFGGHRSVTYVHAPASRPNIIFILADDLGYGDVGCYGQRQIKTPNLDRMAAEGIRFTSAYSGCPLCAPSRCALMTGHHMGHAVIRANSSLLAPPDLHSDIPLGPADTTAAEVLKAAGYATGLVGKWGLGNATTTGSPNRKGFDYAYGFLDQADRDYYPSTLWRNGARIAIPPGSYQQDLFTHQALKFIRGAQQQPFFLYLAYAIPHWPFEIPSNKPYEKEAWPANMKARAAMITRMDRDVGRIFKLLKDLGMDDHTVVFFSSDNGPDKKAGFFHSAGPLNGGKGSLTEGGIRVPMIVRWPEAIAPSQVSAQPWAFWDFLPTAADIAGVTPPAGLDGVSMLPTLLGQQQEANRFLYWEFYPGKANGFMQAARLGKWKAVREDTWDKDSSNPQVTTTFKLYDLESDLGERINVASQQPSVSEDLQKAMNDAHTESPLWPSKPTSNDKVSAVKPGG